MILFVWKLDVYLNLNVYFVGVKAYVETGFTRLHLEKDNFPKDNINKEIYMHLTTHISSKSFIYISIWMQHLSEQCNLCCGRN